MPRARAPALTRLQTHELLFWTENGFTASAVAEAGGLPWPSAKRAYEAFHWRGQDIPCKFESYLAETVLGEPYVIERMLDDDDNVLERSGFKRTKKLREAMPRSTLMPPPGSPELEQALRECDVNVSSPAAEEAWAPPPETWYFMFEAV